MIPIYPVRYGLGVNYLNNARKGQVGHISAPNGILATHTRDSSHRLMQLRQGFIYIYAHTKHRLFSTDKAGKWLVFRYITHSNDMNSASEFERPGGIETHFGQYTFLLYKWGERGANGKWGVGKLDEKRYPCVANVSTFSCPFVDKDVGKVDIAYSEYAWSSEMFERLEKEGGFRKSVMTTIDVDKLLDVNQHPFGSLQVHVLEYAGTKDLSTVTHGWYTQLAPQSGLPKQSSMLPYEKALMVALEDVAGEMHELQKITLDLAQKQADYHAKYLYPITIGNIIDPKIAYDVRGEKYPHKESERVIAQRGVEKALNPQFKSKFTSLLKTSFESYEKPMEKLIEQIWRLGERKAFKFTIGLALQCMLGVKSLQESAYSAYCFFSLLKDITLGTSSTPKGIAYLSHLFGVSLKNESSEPFLEWAKQSLSKGLETLEPLVAQGAKAGFELNEKWSSSKRLYKGLNDFLETGLNVFGQSAALYKSATARHIFSLLGLADIWDDASRTKTAFETLQKILLEESKSQLSQLSQQERVTNKANGKPNRHIDFSAVHRKTFLYSLNKCLPGLVEAEMEKIAQGKANIDFLFTRRYGGTLNFIAVYSGLLALNDDLAIKSKSAKTKAGKWTTNPALVRSAAVMDTAVATMNLSYLAGLISNPTGFTLRNRSGSIWQAIKGQPLKFGYASLGILGGALTAVIAWGGIEEAIANQDAAAFFGYGLLFLSSMMGMTAILARIIAGTIISGPVGWGIGVIALIGSIIVVFFSDSTLVNWVKNGFWGNSDKYYYWDNSDRDEFDKQIQRTEILSQIEPKSPNDKKEHLLISKGFEDEVYGYFIQSGLQITPMGKGRFKISCAEFWRTQPNLTNLKIVCYIPYAESKEIEHAELTLNRDVVFSLRENGITQENIKLEVTFTDKDGTKFSADYTTDDYLLHTIMI